jgi:hypothetical protein
MSPNFSSKKGIRYPFYVAQRYSADGDLKGAR